jgi:hypothetical protein
MKTYAFEFISAFDGSSDYRLFVDGMPDTRFTLVHATSRLHYADGSPMLNREVQAFQEYKDEQLREALARYPEYKDEPFMLRHVYSPDGQFEGMG